VMANLREETNVRETYDTTYGYHEGNDDSFKGMNDPS